MSEKADIERALKSLEEAREIRRNRPEYTDEELEAAFENWGEDPTLDSEEFQAALTRAKKVYKEYPIDFNYRILNGKAVFTGTRISVEYIVSLIKERFLNNILEEKRP